MQVIPGFLWDLSFSWMKRSFVGVLHSFSIFPREPNWLLQFYIAVFLWNNSLHLSSFNVLIICLVVWRNLLFVSSWNKFYLVKRELRVEMILETTSSDFHEARSLLARFVLNDFWYKAKLCTRCVVFYNNYMVQAFNHFPLRPFNICFIKIGFRCPPPPLQAADECEY